jgi:energy-converting hydrogenase Eha subunit F
MGSRWLTGLFSRLKALFFGRPAPLSDYARARQLIAAVDRGGIPLNPAKVNAIARSLGLEVARQAPVEATLERIRLALARATEP